MGSKEDSVSSFGIFHVWIGLRWIDHGVVTIGGIVSGIDRLIGLPISAILHIVFGIVKHVLNAHFVLRTSSEFGSSVRLLSVDTVCVDSISWQNIKLHWRVLLESKVKEVHPIGFTDKSVVSPLSSPHLSTNLMHMEENLEYMERSWEFRGTISWAGIFE